MSGKFRVRGVYGGPLVRGTPLEDEYDRTEVLEKAGAQAVKEIQREIRRLTFKGSAKNLLDSFSYRVEGRSTLVIESTHPAARFLDKGVRRHQMRHLLKAARPIPIVKDNGEVIFRSATPKSMTEGKWVHPGIRGKNFVEKGVERAREAIKRHVAEDIRKRVLKRFNGQ